MNRDRAGALRGYEWGYSNYRRTTAIGEAPAQHGILVYLSTAEIVNIEKGDPAGARIIRNGGRVGTGRKICYVRHRRLGIINWGKSRRPNVQILAVFPILV